jgi:hypothetical protein
MRRILHAAIGVVHQAGHRPLPHDRHVERGKGEFMPDTNGPGL